MYSENTVPFLVRDLSDHKCWYSLGVLGYLGMILCVKHVWYQGMKVLWLILSWTTSPSQCLLSGPRAECYACFVANVCY